METLFTQRLLPPVGGLYDWDLTKLGLRTIQCSLLQIALHDTKYHHQCHDNNNGDNNCVYITHDVVNHH